MSDLQPLPMLMPTGRALSRLLRSLLGEHFAFAAQRGTPNVDDFASGFGAICFDDMGAATCAIVADLAATISLGGKLLMLSETALKNQIAAGRADEVVVEAVSEIFNNLTTTINLKEGNAHIRSHPATAIADLLASQDGAWMAAATIRRDYHGDFGCGKGKMAILAR